MIDPSGLIPNALELTCIDPAQPGCWAGVAADVLSDIAPALLGAGGAGTILGSRIFPQQANPPEDVPGNPARPKDDGCNRANRTHAKVRDRIRRENEGYESGRHDEYSSAMRDELNRLAKEAEAKGDSPEFINRLREIAKTYGKRADGGHKGGGRAGRGRR